MEIDISSTLDKFTQFVENSSRMILSAKFGDGKSYLLNKFMEQDNPKNSQYYFVVLHPVNYVVEENKDIIEYIKRDILLQLVSDDKVFNVDELDAEWKAIEENKDIFVDVLDFFLSLSPLESISKIGGQIKKIISKVIHIRERTKEIKGLPERYIASFSGRGWSISECDGFTKIIQDTIKHIEEISDKRTVLIIEDMDRLDPAHLFRILNIFGSQIDNPYYANEDNGNKFGFSKVLLVMDYDTTEHIFHHFYGENADYEGYMQKFLDSAPFKFSIRREAQKMIEDKLKSTIGVGDDLLTMGLEDIYGRQVISIHNFIEDLSVRRCKQILEEDWSKLYHIDKENSPIENALIFFSFIGQILPSNLSMSRYFDLLVNKVNGITLNIL